MHLQDYVITTTDYIIHLSGTAFKRDFMAKNCSWKKTQKYTVNLAKRSDVGGRVQIIMWNLHSIFKNPTCTNQNSVTHALEDKKGGSAGRAETDATGR